MSIFNPPHFLRQISKSALREFTDAHPIAAYLSVDWDGPDDSAEGVQAAIEALQASLDGTDVPEDAAQVGEALDLWHDDLRRVHLLSNELAVNEFLAACAADAQAQEVFANRDVREKALWVFHAREQLFRDVELHLAFQAKANGKYWKKHRIAAGLSLTRERDKLEAFSREVAKLFAKSGGGKSAHIEQSVRATDGSVQLTIYVEGPVTAFAHFTESRFNRVTTRIALETAVVYQPATGVIESVVKGGAKNHQTVLQLFGKHVAGQEIKPKEIVTARFKLNELRDGVPAQAVFVCPEVESIRLRRAQFRPHMNTGIGIHMEAPPEPEQDDAMALAHERLKFQHTFETEYDLNQVSILVYLKSVEGRKPKHFSFDVRSAGTSTIKNLSASNQRIANAVLQALDVIDPEEGGV